MPKENDEQAKRTSAAKNGAARDQEASGKGPAIPMRAGAGKRAVGDAIAALKADHRAVEQMFKKYEAASDDAKPELIEQICKALTVHTMLEEEIFYPACRKAFSEDEPLQEAQVEHDSAKMLIASLQSARGGDEYRDAKVTVLAEQVRHHVGEEEKPGEGIFAQAEANGVNTPDLAEELKQRRAQLEPEDPLPVGAPIALNGFPGARSPQMKESEMPRSQEQTRSRDERGRFSSDDDRGRYRDDDRSYSSRGSNYRERDDEGRFTSGRGGGRGRDNDDRDYGRGEGRGWYGDSRGHAEAARRGWDERDRGGRSSRDYDDDRSYSSRGSNYRERDDEGRFTSGRGGGRGRDDDDDRGRGHGGWFGDSEGHSEAARRGWDDRGGSRNSRRDDDDDRSYRTRSSRRDDDDDRDRGQGGWFGDPKGHSEASRRGWENRGNGGRSSRGRDDDDDRSYRSRSSRRDDDDDDRGRGHGGWFGDPEGHSEASRRGWESRH